MSRTGSYNPRAGQPEVLTVTPNTVVGCDGFRAVVLTQGSIFVRYGQSTAVSELVMTVGTHREPGRFKEIWTDGTIVLLPAATVIKYGA